jgi:hypothetical protein
MKKADKERLNSITRTLAEQGVDSFLIIGLRHLTGQADNEREAFFVRTEDDRLLLWALDKVLTDNLDLAEVLADVLRSIHERLKGHMDRPGIPTGNA